jgi:hypothetical protein
MRDLSTREGGLVRWAPFLTAVSGFFIALALLLGILGGYILGALLLLLGAIAAPVIATVALTRWVIQSSGVELPIVKAFPADWTVTQAEVGVEPGRLRHADLLRELSAADLARVAAIGQKVHFLQGDMLAEQGQTGSDIYIILDGQAMLTADSVAGELTLRIAGPGESLPLAALLGNGTLISTAYAMTNLEAVRLPAAAFRQLCQQHPNIGSSVYRAVANILAARYQNSLHRLVNTMDQALAQPDVFANV